MVNRDESQARELLRQRLLRRCPEWNGGIRVENSGEAPIVALEVPGHPGHRLSVAISGREATIAYDDGRPPGPAEKLLLWGSDPPADGVDAICGFVEALIRGEVALVRERVSGLIRILRGDKAESILRFVPAAELARWSARRRRRILRAWAWDPGKHL
jgi:hypothetical protein